MLLDVRNIQVSYGLSQVIFGVSLAVSPGEVITLLGRNGMGKTTTIRAIVGLCPPHAGQIELTGRAVHGLAPHRIARLGVGLVPEGRHIFPNLSVQENLLMAHRPSAQPGQQWTLPRVLSLFPRLSERLDHGGNHLSGGEQQMLAIGRALMTNPSLLILDEATEGLAPLIRTEIWSHLELLKQSGLAMILIDKDLQALSKLADRHYILEKGRIVWTGQTRDLLGDESLRTTYLGV